MFFNGDGRSRWDTRTGVQGRCTQRPALGSPCKRLPLCPQSRRLGSRVHVNPDVGSLAGGEPVLRQWRKSCQFPRKCERRGAGTPVTSGQEACRPQTWCTEGGGRAGPVSGAGRWPWRPWVPLSGFCGVDCYLVVTAEGGRYFLAARVSCFRPADAVQAGRAPFWGDVCRSGRG